MKKPPNRPGFTHVQMHPSPNVMRLWNKKAARTSSAQLHIVIGVLTGAFGMHYDHCNPLSRITAGFLSRAGAETPLNFREKIRVFPRTILENFSGVDTQTAVLVSTAEVWISAPDTQTPVFLGFLGIHSFDWEGKKYTPEVCSALKTQVPQQAKKRFGVYQKACFQWKKKENTYTPKSLQGVCMGPLRTVLVYRFWPPIGMEVPALHVNKNAQRD